MREHINAIFGSYSEIFFLKKGWVGLIMMAVTMINPNVGLAGIIAMVSAYAFALFLHMNKTFLGSGFYTYNPLLVGLSIGCLFKLGPLTIVFVVIAGILTFVLTHMMQSVLSYYLRLPVLSFPFVIISSLGYLASARYSNLLTIGLYPQATSKLELYVPLWLLGMFKSLGAILFMPNVLAGALMLLLFLLSSRIVFMLVILGYYTGTLISAMMTGSFPDAFTNINHFNYIWIAIAIGGIFLIPSLKSYVLALVAVATSTLLLHAMEVFWASYGIPAFALPYNVISLAFIYVLGVTAFPLMSTRIKGTPEESLDHYLSTTLRFQGTMRTLSLPFAGQWLIWQGNNGKWTHQGSWQYAYDFVMTDDQGHTCKKDGQHLEHYYAFRKPVLSPIRGRVTQVTNNLPDNTIGSVDKTNNWGNMVIIYDARGFWVELSHFSQDSIKVKEGDWVEKGTLLGLCGNSGYSPQPHIHIQVQATEQIGSATLPFSFVSFVTQGTFHANAQPEEDAVVEPVQPDRAMKERMTFILDRQYTYNILQSGKKVGTLTLMVKMAPDGTFYFDSGRDRLYFGIHEGTFYFYQMEGHNRYLNLFFLALPRLPLAYRDQIHWEDFIPVGTVCRGIKKNVILFLSSFYHDLNKIKTQCTFISKHRIQGSVSSKTLNIKGTTLVELDEESGIKSVQFEDMELRLVSQNSTSYYTKSHDASVI